MKLETMTEKDVELRVRLETDPQLMAELGGPRPREAIERAHAKSLALAAEGRCWPLKIIPDGGSSPAGGVDVFESSHEDEAIYEIGWMILPEFQNRGIASQAVREVLERARGVRKFGQIHAFPAVTNGPSNKICEKNGFTNLGECDVEFAGRVFAAITGGSICSESGGGGEEQEPSGGLGSSSAGVLQRTDRMKRDAGMLLLPHPRPARRIASRAGT